MKAKQKSTVQKQSKQQVITEIQPEPIQFFYKKLKEERDSKILEREKMSTKESLNENLTKEEIYKLEVEKQKKEKRDNQIAVNSQRERYGARGSRPLFQEICRLEVK